MLTPHNENALDKLVCLALSRTAEAKELLECTYQLDRVRWGLIDKNHTIELDTNLNSNFSINLINKLIPNGILKKHGRNNYIYLTDLLINFTTWVRNVS